MDAYDYIIINDRWKTVSEYASGHPEPACGRQPAGRFYQPDAERIGGKKGAQSMIHPSYKELIEKINEGQESDEAR